MATKNLPSKGIDQLVETFQATREELINLSNKISSLEEKITEVRKNNDELFSLMIKGNNGASFISKISILQTEVSAIHTTLAASLIKDADIQKRMQDLENFKGKITALATVVSIISGILSGVIIKLWH